MKPPIPPDTDVRGLHGFMLNIDRLFASELWALSTGDEFKAALALWGWSWKQQPPGSLPNDDAVLAAFSGAGRKWPKIKRMAMHGFVLCDDGRLYHSVLCEDVARAATKKIERHERTKAANEARKLAALSARNNRRDDERNVPSDEGRDDHVTRSHRQGQGQGQKNEKKEPCEPESESGSAGGRAAESESLAFEGKAIRLTEAGMAECRKVYPLDDLTSQLAVYDAKFTERAQFPPLSTVLAWLCQDARRRNGEALAGGISTSGAAPASGHDQPPTTWWERAARQEQARIESYRRTGFWLPEWGDEPPAVAVAARA